MRKNVARILMVSYAEREDMRVLSRRLAQSCHADLEFLESSDGNTNMFTGLADAVRAALHLDTRIPPAGHDPGTYDMVVLGTVARCWNVPAPVRAYVSQHRGRFRRISLFCTHNGLGAGKVLRDLVELCGRPAAATLAVRHDAIAREQYFLDMARFARSIRSSCYTRRADLVATASPHTELFHECNANRLP